jgi:hypothetical protein
MEAINQAMPYLRQTLSGSAIKNLFEMPEGVKVEDYKKSLDALCQDPRNSKISIANAFIVCASFDAETSCMLERKARRRE